MRRYFLALGLTMICCAVVFAILGYLAQVGFHNAVEAGSALREASQDWQAGQFGRAAGKYALASSMAVQAGVRYAILPIYTDQMVHARDAGDLQKALNICRQAATMLHPYDSEGTQSYYCDTLEERIRRGH